MITGIDDEGDIRKDCIFYTPEHEVSGGASPSVSRTFTDLFPLLKFSYPYARKNVQVSGTVNEIEKFRGVPVQANLGVTSLETFSGGCQLKKSPYTTKSCI